MKIKPTEEMQQILGFPDDAATQLCAILAIVERDHIIQERCPEQIMEDIRCELPAGNDGHSLLRGQHRCRLANGNVVTWS